MTVKDNAEAISSLGGKVDMILAALGGEDEPTTPEVRATRAGRRQSAPTVERKAAKATKAKDTRTPAERNLYAKGSLYLPIIDGFDVPAEGVFARTTVVAIDEAGEELTAPVTFDIPVSARYMVDHEQAERIKFETREAKSGRVPFIDHPIDA